ncbi:hypothetical protein MHJ97_00615 [Macrococcus epidermidis]|uniref:hypothetical protein n=1 Tax=Macrococcus epidermidis TaxID=1902580 RepID=UPI001EF19D10|nr:hypothetical protein [Macrococcus epidermidis]MCG7418933.1 hypothetical protein [Macrococcus epidermidis]
MLVSSILKNGISGFNSNSNEMMIPEEKQFQAFFYAFAMEVEGIIVSFDTNLTGKNFYSCHIIVNEGDFYVLLNSIYPMIAFARKVGYFDIEFIDNEKYKQFFQNSYRLLNISELNEKLIDMEHQLNKYELEQAKYYESKTAGEVIFNHWD